MPGPPHAADLAVRRRYSILVPRPMPVMPRRYLIVASRPLPAAPLVVRRRYLIVVLRPFFCSVVRCTLHELDRDAKSEDSCAACGASQVLGRGVQADARGLAYCALQVIGRKAQAFPAAALAVRRRYLAVVPRPVISAPRK